ncbi:MAG: 4-hydroxy-tetrahydrodipicolinate reductase [Elusimicrobiota bacterium]
MLKIGVSGGRGRMGQKITGLILDNPDLKLSGVLENPDHGDCGKTIDGIKVSSDIEEVVKKSDVMIDFSSPENTLKVAKVCSAEKVKLVIGTTGFTKKQKEKIKKYASSVPVLLAPNMSVGVNIIFKIAKEISQSIPGYEKEIVEAHHNKKADAPSGTAQKLADIISKKEDRQVYGRKGRVGERDKNEVGIHAVRGGNIVGEHTVMWIGPHDRIELTHRASSRGLFASGAVRAALWLAGEEKNRLYSMQDVLAGK